MNRFSKNPPLKKHSHIYIYMEMFSFRGVVPPSWSDLNTEPFFVIRPVF